MLDHSGNILRFRADFEDVFFNGFGSLDDSEKLDKAVREDDEHAGSKCPKCGFSPFCKHCMACGYEKVAQAMVDEAPGEMREIRIGKSVIASDKRDLWQQLCGYVTEMGNKPGRAWHLYREIVGTPPPRGWTYESTAPAQPSRGTLNKIKSLRIAYLKGRESAELRAIT